MRTMRAEEEQGRKRLSERDQIQQRKDGSWWARLIYFDSQGKRREAVRRAANKSDARVKRDELKRTYQDHGAQTLMSANMTFDELADYFEKSYLIPAQYIDGRKVAGRRSLKAAKTFLGELKKHFGVKRLQSIRFADVERYKALRLATPTRTGGQRSIASVNRELGMLRRMLNVAMRDGWITKNPFSLGEPLINVADERMRERIITREEEDLLLAACTGRRSHLRPIIICALDTGMRLGEILKLRWSDIDFESNLMIVRAFNTKTMRERTVGMTPRIIRELAIIYEQSHRNPDDLTFGITDNVRKSFNAARKAAGLLDVRFHDLRHTAATRLVQAHLQLAEVGRVLGHTQPSTTYRYVNANIETARRAADALASFSESRDDRSEPAAIH
jgi:integrase